MMTSAAFMVTLTTGAGLRKAAFIRDRPMMFCLMTGWYSGRTGSLIVRCWGRSS